MKKLLIIYLITMMFIFFTSCDSNKESNNSVKIALQYGLAYSPIHIMKHENFLEEENIDVKWMQLSNTMAIREAMLADELDVGFVGIPPFLIGKDNGMEWRIIQGLSISPLGLVSNDKNITSLSDFTNKDKIALPQVGSIQHILLSMSCEKELGNPKALDNNLVGMSHPDAMTALKSNTEIKAHYTSMPYLFEELKDEDMHLVTTGKEGFGEEFTFIVGVCKKDFYDNLDVYEKFEKALYRSIEFIYENRDETAQILANEFDMKKDVIYNYLYEEGMEFTKKILGLERFIKFMYEKEFIENNYDAMECMWN